MRISRREARALAQDHPHLEADPTYARLVMRRVSPPVTYAIVRWTSLSADSVTGLAIGSGFIAAALVVTGHPIAFVAAAILLQLSYLFDTVDGEVARVRGTAGRRGTYLDLVGHVLQNRALYAACAYILLEATDYPGWALAISFAGLAFASAFGEQARAQVVGSSAGLPSAHGARVAGRRPSSRQPAAGLYSVYQRLAFVWAYPASMNLFSVALITDAATMSVGLSAAPVVLPAFTAAFLATLAIKQLVNALRLLDRRLWDTSGLGST